MHTTATTHTEAVAPVLEALDHLDTLRTGYASAVGSDSVVVRHDLLGGLGLVIVYASTKDYMLESRAAADGRSMHRINRDWYASAAEIPATYRKARRIAEAVERNSAAALISADRAHKAAYAAYRQTGF